MGPYLPIGQPRGITAHDGQLREVNTLVSIAHHHTGKPQGWIRNELRSLCSGRPIAAATTDQLRARIEAVRSLQT